MSIPAAASRFHSVNLGLFGVFWAVSTAFLLLMIKALKKVGIYKGGLYTIYSLRQNSLDNVCKMNYNIDNM